MGKCISIVTPAMNEQGNLPELYTRVRDFFAGYDSDLGWELIIVNDGSTDDTRQVAEQLVATDARVVCINLARNFGQQPALIAGLEATKGNAVITIDADLEQPPEEMATMIDAWKDGAQIVHRIRNDHPDTSFFKKWSSKQFYKVFSFLSKMPLEPGMLDFRLMDRQVIDAVLAMPETDFFLRGLSTWVGFSQVRIPYLADIRRRGETKYTLRHMINFALKGITSFSTYPLRLATFVGLAMMLIAASLGGYVGIRYFFWEHPTPGYASTILLLSFFMGMQFLLIGMLGEYVARIHVEVKRRPRFLIQSVLRRDNLSSASNEPCRPIKLNGE